MLNVEQQRTTEPLSFFNKILVFSILNVIFQVLLIFVSDDLIIISVFNLFLFLFFLLIVFKNDIPVFLLILNLSPLVLFIDELHYYLKFILLSDIPLFAFTLLVYGKYLNTEKDYSFSISGLRFPIILVTLYFSFSAILGLIRGYDPFKIVDEYYHLLYYPLALVITYLVRDNDDYEKIFKAIIIISLIIALEYIYYNTTMTERFVTFQSGIMPLVSSILLSYILLGKKNVLLKLTLFSALIIILTGTFLTLTRVLWVATAISLITVFLYYLKSERKFRSSTIILILLLLLLPISLVSSEVVKQRTEKSDVTTDVSYRTESIVNPGEDLSFLLRLEIGYYIILKVMENPILGTGLGDVVQYKILTVSNEPIHYPDNSWLYFLWKGGIIGFILFLWLYYLIIRNSYRIFSFSEEVNTRVISLGILCGMWGYLVYSMFAGNLNKYRSSLIIAICIAFLISNKTKINKKQIEINTLSP